MGTDCREIPLKWATLLIVVAAGSLALRPERSLADKPLSEDAYYAFTVSRNIARGDGPTAGGARRTSGFQPLFTFLSIPAFVLAGENRYAGLRYIIVLHWGFYVATAYILGLIARSAVGLRDCVQNRLVFWNTVLAYLGGTYIFLTHFNGLETGLFLFLIALAWRFYQVGALENWARCMTFGMILGLVVLARIDAVFLVIIICLYKILSRGPSTYKERLKQFAQISLVAFLVSSPWWLYNLIGFGSLIPSSGRAQEAWMVSLARAKFASLALLQAAMPWVYLSRFGGLFGDLARAILAAGGVVFAWKNLSTLRMRSACQETQTRLLKRTLEFGSCLLMATLVLVVWYALSSWATHFYSRYFSAMMLVSTLVAGFLLSQSCERIPKMAPAIAGTLSIPILLAIGLAHCGRLLAGNTMYSQQLQLVQEYAPPEEWVGAGQSGTLGYFREHTLNLDGKVNAEALHYQNNMWVYLEKRNVRWLCDWPGYATRYLGPSPPAHGWRLVATKGDFQIYQRDAHP